MGLDKLKVYGEFVHAEAIVCCISAGLWLFFQGWSLKGWTLDEVNRGGGGCRCRRRCRRHLRRLPSSSSSTRNISNTTATTTTIDATTAATTAVGADLPGCTRECIRYIPMAALLFVWFFVYIIAEHDKIRAQLNYFLTLATLLLLTVLSSISTLILAIWRVQNWIILGLINTTTTTTPPIHQQQDLEMVPLRDRSNHDKP